MMKYALSLAALFLLCAAASQAVLALPQSSGQDQAREDQAGSWPTPDEVVSKLDSKLSLTDDQKAKITPIIAERQEKLKALQADTSGRRLRKARKAKSIFEDSDKKIKAVLTDDQKQKYEAMQQEMRQQARERLQQRASNNSSQ